MRKSTFTLWATGLVIVGTFSPSLIHQASHVYDTFRAGRGHYDRGVRLFASYVSKPTTVPDMVRTADLVAVVTALQSSLGRAVVTEHQSLQFEFVDFRIDELLKGEFTAVTIERLADVQNGRPVILPIDGGSFAPGTRHLVFLRKQPDSPFYYLLNDEARFSLTSEQRLLSDGQGNVATRLRSLSLAAATNLIRGSL